MTTILGIKLEERCKSALELQKILTDFGCSIKNRLGLHMHTDNKCTNYGIILLELADDVLVKELEKELCGIENIEIQKMIFN